jgi:hypothetical protein
MQNDLGGQPSDVRGVVLGSAMDSLDLTFGMNTSSGTSFNSNSSNTPVIVNTWQHIAITRQSGICRLFINGVQVGNNITNNSNVTSNKKILGIGKYYSDRVFDWMYYGYIDEVRVSNIARYTSNFIPSNSQFISDSNTAFLCHFDNADVSDPNVRVFVDSGPNNIGITGRCNCGLSSNQKKFGNYSLWLGGVYGG